MVDLPILRSGMLAILLPLILRTIMSCDEVYYGDRIRMRQLLQVTISHVLLLLPGLSLDGFKVDENLLCYTFHSEFLASS